MATTYEVGKRLVDLCNAGKFMDAAKELYADSIASIEAMSGPGMPARTEGKPAVLKKAEWWESNHEVHSSKAEGPWENGDRFIVRFSMDVTAKAGPMAGKRMKMEEAGIYTVNDGKVVQEEFFYHM